MKYISFTFNPIQENTYLLWDETSLEAAILDCGCWNRQEEQLLEGSIRAHGLKLKYVLHSLAIAELIRFKPGTNIMDLGTGGGFPGIPLAIMFPEAKFHLVDSIGKKIRVCEEVSKALGLQNVTTQWCRAEEVKQQFHFIVSRAVMPLPDLVKIIRKAVNKEQFNGLPNGLICLKGGELEQEARPFGKVAQITSLSEYFEEPFFETKKLVYLPL